MLFNQVAVNGLGMPMAEPPPIPPESPRGSLSGETLICPRCQELLVPKLEHGIEIDVCPQCSGVWLDRSELDQLLAAALWEVERYASKISDQAIDHPGRSSKSVDEVFFGFKNSFGKFLGKLRKSR